MAVKHPRETLLLGVTFLAVLVWVLVLVIWKMTMKRRPWWWWLWLPPWIGLGTRKGRS